MGVAETSSVLLLSVSGGNIGRTNGVVCRPGTGNLHAVSREERVDQITPHPIWNRNGEETAFLKLHIGAVFGPFSVWLRQVTHFGEQNFQKVPRLRVFGCGSPESAQRRGLKSTQSTEEPVLLSQSARLLRPTRRQPPSKDDRRGLHLRNSTSQT